MPPPSRHSFGEDGPSVDIGAPIVVSPLLKEFRLFGQDSATNALRTGDQALGFNAQLIEQHIKLLDINLQLTLKLADASTKTEAAARIEADERLLTKSLADAAAARAELMAMFKAIMESPLAAAVATKLGVGAGALSAENKAAARRVAERLLTPNDPLGAPALAALQALAGPDFPAFLSLLELVD